MCVKAASERGKANAAKNQYPHRLGSGGYKTAVRKWAKDPKAQLPGSSSGSSLSFEDDNRAYDWFKARAKWDDRIGDWFFPDEATQLTYERAVHLLKIFVTKLFTNLNCLPTV